MVMLFPISINLTELLERFGQLSVSIVCSAIEQELRDQGEVVRLVVLDARGQPIMDSSHTRSKLLYSVYSFFVLRSYQVFVFRKKKPQAFSYYLPAMNQSVPSTVTPKIFQALVSRICEFTEWDVYPGEGIRVVKFHILHFL